METTGTRIKAARIAAGLTQAELADKVGVKYSAIHKYEAGLVVNLKRDTIARLASALNVSPSYLLCIDEGIPAIASDDGQKKNIVKIAGRDTSAASSVSASDPLSPADCALLAAYHAAPPEIQNIVRTALAPYKTQNPAASENAAG